MADKTDKFADQGANNCTLEIPKNAINEGETSNGSAQGREASTKLQLELKCRELVTHGTGAHHRCRDVGAVETPSIQFLGPPTRTANCRDHVFIWTVGFIIGTLWVGEGWGDTIKGERHNVVVDLLHNFHLECGARLHKLRV